MTNRIASWNLYNSASSSSSSAPPPPPIAPPNKSINVLICLYLMNLPKDIIHTILLFTGRFRIENGKAIGIIPKEDERYQMLFKKMQLKSRQYYSYRTNEEPDDVYVRRYVQVNTKKFFEISIEPYDDAYIWKCRVHAYPCTELGPTHELYECIIE